jgi:hypothetical protein
MRHSGGVLERPDHTLGQSLPNRTYRAMSGLLPVATELPTSRIGSDVPTRENPAALRRGGALLS